VVLNDNFSGGEFQFKDRVGNEKINLSFGDILIYPSNENYKYKELLVTSGIKYTAIAYF
jgi:predicted 2-oxoglutarate/Fe(II)-dependent dioxygenase YbiX